MDQKRQNIEYLMSLPPYNEIETHTPNRYSAQTGSDSKLSSNPFCVLYKCNVVKNTHTRHTEKKHHTEWHHSQCRTDATDRFTHITTPKTLIKARTAAAAAVTAATVTIPTPTILISFKPAARTGTFLVRRCYYVFFLCFWFAVECGVWWNSPTAKKHGK